MADFIKTSFESGVKLYATDLNTNFNNLLSVIDIYNEDLTALTDGSEVTFSVAHKYQPGTLRIYLEGARVRKDNGTLYYNEITDIDGRGTGFTLSSAPGSGDELIVDYKQSNEQL